MFPVLIYVPNILETIWQITSAGMAIIAIALVMYATNLNLRDHLILAFISILACVTVIFTGETLAGVANEAATIQFFLQVKWSGLVLLPAVYLHFSDELLTLTGRPSRGRRRRMVFLVYILSLIGLILVWLGWLIGKLSSTKGPMVYLERNQITFGFGIFYLIVMAMATYNLVRTLYRARTVTTRRRLFYLLAGAAAPALASIVFMYHGNPFFAQYPNFFWILSIISGLLTGFFIIIMAYVVSFFGVNWTDRTVRSRLFRWLLRGPFVASVTLGMTTITRRLGEASGNPYSAFVPMVQVGTILLLEFAINIFSPAIEKRLFGERDREGLVAIQNLSERLLTKDDLKQFLENVAASICDRLQVSGCMISLVENNHFASPVLAGERRVFQYFQMDEELLRSLRNNNEDESMLVLGKAAYFPLESFDNPGQANLVGVLAVPAEGVSDLDEGQLEAVVLLAERASLAIKDRRQQQRMVESIASLQPELEFIQQLRAETSYGPREMIKKNELVIDEGYSEWVRDALTHYWGGPKLMNNPLLELKIVSSGSEENNGNRMNALRTVLKEAIERTSPGGERKYTGDWLLYNLLDLKYVQGRKVREVAHKLSISEADLYRKQKVAIEAVARNLIEMENKFESINNSTGLEN